MYYNDHMPPHFHPEYNDKRAVVDILKSKVIKGALPSKQLKLVLAWDINNGDLSSCIDIDPDTLYELDEVDEKI